MRQRLKVGADYHDTRRGGGCEMANCLKGLGVVYPRKDLAQYPVCPAMYLQVPRR